MPKREMIKLEKGQPLKREKIIAMSVFVVIVAAISVKMGRNPEFSLYIFTILAPILFLVFYAFWGGGIIHDILSAVFIISLFVYPLIILDSFNTALSGTFISGSAVNLIASLSLYIISGMGFFKKFIVSRDSYNLIIKSAVTSAAILLITSFIYLHSIYLKP